MSTTICENCAKSIPGDALDCSNCGFPNGGTEQEKRHYHTQMYRVRDLVESSLKSARGILSISFIFFFMAAVVLAFSLIFGEQHFLALGTYALAGGFYLALSKLGTRHIYFMVLGAFFGYMMHTLFELSFAIIPSSPVPLDHTFTESKGATLFFALIPVAYLVFRLSLMLVLGKYLLTELRLKGYGKMGIFVRKQSEITPQD